MRTTLSLDDDVAAALRQIQSETGQSWKSVVNDAMRLGISAYLETRRRPHEVRRTQGVSLGAPRIGDISNVHEVLSVIEGEDRQ